MKKLAMNLRVGDRFTVEPEGGSDFDAVLEKSFGWGLVHGQIDLGILRLDTGERFTYGIRYDTTVEVSES